MTRRPRGGRTEYFRAATVVANAVLIGISTQGAHAAESAYGFGYVAEHSDNILRTPTNERGDWIHSLLLGAAYRDAGAVLASSILGQVQTNKYQHDTFDDATLYFLDAAAVWTIAPTVLTWTVEDFYTQVARDSALADTPENRVEANVVDTGPDMNLRVGSWSSFHLGGRYGSVNFRDAGGDNGRVRGYVRWLAKINSSTDVSVNYDKLDVEYDDAVNMDFARTEQYLRLQVTPARSRFTVDIGRTEVDWGTDPATDGGLARVDWQYRISTDSTFSVNLSREYRDTGVVLLSSVTNPVAPQESEDGVAAADAVADVYYLRGAEVRYSSRYVDWDFGIRGFSRQFDYQQNPNDRKLHGWRVDVTNNPEGQFVTSVFGETQNTEWLDIVREDNDKSIGIRWRYRATRSLSFVLEGSRFWRSSSDAGFDYTDQRIQFGAFYSSGPLYSPARR